jgi:hypothetical protein
METSIETPLPQSDTDAPGLQDEPSVQGGAVRELTALELAYVGGGTGCVTFH